MPEVVTATLVVSFPSVDTTVKGSGLLRIEVDDRDTGLNDGVTSFSPGETIWYLVYAQSNLVNIRHYNSINSTVNNFGTATRTISELVVFANDDEGNLSYPSRTGFTPVWLGANGGPVNLVPGSENKLILSGDKVGVLSVSYDTSFTQHTISTPSQVSGVTNYTIVIVILADVAGT